MLYVAVPVGQEPYPQAVVRISIFVTGFEHTLGMVYSRIALGGLLIAALTAALFFVVSRHISKPIEEMKNNILAFARGDFTRKLTVPESEELGILAEAVNEMARELDKKLQTITQQRNEQESIFGSMLEGVVAVDKDERIVHLNRAAEEILGCEAAKSKGRFVQEVIRNPELQSFVQSALESKDLTESDISWHDEEERYFQIRGSALRDGSGNSIGAVVVINEVTRLYRLERIRRDFVANVSHELRTPITSIRGFAETLLESDKKDGEEAKRFLNIIIRQSSRLNAIIEDLLAFSRLEKQSEQNEVRLSPGNVKEVLLVAAQACEMQAAEKNISVRINCNDTIMAEMDEDLLERAVTNLIDNAVKYSPADTRVEVECHEAGDGVVLSVADQGPGIAEEHLARIFERFYRVDKARSRKLGGTGLGLAIVKHIAKVHGGNVEVESVLGKGSRFSIYLRKPVAVGKR